MKAERRHELQTNSLALWLRWRAPELAQKYGTRVILGVIFLALIIVLVRYRLNAPKVAAEEARVRLAAARELVNELSAGAPPSQVSGVLKLITEATDRSDDRQIQASAYLTLGDYYWALANYAAPPEAATRPALMPEQPREKLLADAQAAYSKALAAQSEQGYLVAAAHLGLAAVAEDRAFEASRGSSATTVPAGDGQWAAAREHYQAVVDLANAPEVLKEQARWHLGRLPMLQQPVWLVASTQPTSEEAGAMAPLGPPGPTTAPSTQPAQ